MSDIYDMITGRIICNGPSPSASDDRCWFEWIGGDIAAVSQEALDELIAQGYVNQDNERMVIGDLVLRVVAHDPLRDLYLVERTQ